MKLYKKSWQQKIDAKIEEVWSFFSRPENLNALTPPSMNFQIITNVEDVKMEKGALIDYKVSPFPLVRFKWRTLITDVIPLQKFADEQLKGPYSFWRHEHIFEDHGDYVIMKDQLEYGLPLGLLGQMVNAVVVSRRIDDIFSYRRKIVDMMFNQKVSDGNKK